MKHASYIVVSLIALLIVWKVADAISGGIKNEGETVNRTIDTVYAKPDTLIKKDTVFISKVEATIDTVFVDSNKVAVAIADTTIEKDSAKLNLKYYFPPLNYFDVEVLDIKERIITQTITVLDSVRVEVQKPFTKDYWFWSTVILGLLMILTGNR